ncbi:MAG: TldD/PmbA family protein [Planctomycetes bacterium]|nr:TldD/PmbA family protein [Planctomycetota bacterium]
MTATAPLSASPCKDREARLLDIGTGLALGGGADEIEAVFLEGRSYLTRFSRNHIHQNVGTEEVWAILRVVVGKRLGVATASSLRPEALAGARDEAVAIARASDPVEDWPGLPPPRPVEPLAAYDAATAEASADARASMAGAVIDAARAVKGEAAGAVEIEEGTLAVASSAGVAVASSHTRATVHTVVTCGDGSGYAEGQSTRIGDLAVRAIGRRAARKAADSRSPRPLPPGRYDVILEPAATAEWVEFLSYIAFSGKTFQEGRSPLSGRLGQRVTGEAVTIWDNGRDPRTLPHAFDFEGMPARRLTLISRGVAKAVGTGYYRARRLGKRRSTGHALPASASFECLPMRLFMKGGQASLERLIKQTQRGLLITRFHYTNILDPLKTVLTGMTRDGTFLVENGTVVGPVKNLRYTENVLEALGRIDGASRRLTLTKAGCVVPAVRMRGVQFTGATEF